MRNLLIITQKVDPNDDLLGFFVDWIEEFKKHTGVTVLALKQRPGEYKLVRWVRLLWDIIIAVPRSDAIFIHMSPMFAVLAGPWAWAWRKPIYLWYLHRANTTKLKVATWFSKKVFTASAKSLTLKSDKIVEVGHGISISRFAANPKHEFRNSKPGILSVGRISPIKDYETLLKTGLPVTIIGRPVMPSDFEYFEKLKQYKNATFTGFVPFSEMPKYYARADIVVNTSPTGGLDKTVLEAMASGCLVLVCNDAFGLPANCVFKYGDQEDLLRKLNHLISMSIQDKATLSDELLFRVGRNHDVKETVAKIVGVKPRVLIASPQDSFFTLPHVRAFEILGYAVEVVETRHGLIFSNSVLRKISRLIGIRRYLKLFARRRLNTALMRKVNAIKPALLFVIKGDGITHESIENIKAQGVVTVLFFIDLLDHWERISKIALWYDYFFNQDHLVLEKVKRELGHPNAYYMAHAMEPLPDNEPWVMDNKSIAVSFVGSRNPAMYPRREPMLESIKDLGLKIWGTPDWRDSVLKEYYQGPAIGDKRLAIYRSSKIVVDINWEHVPANGLSNRPFEVCGSGACYVTDGMRSDLANAYDIGIEVVVISDAHDLRKRVLELLADGKVLESIARAGYKKTLARHTYVDRMRNMLSLIGRN